MTDRTVKGAPPVEIPHEVARDMVRRLVRIETRATNALRYMGVPPNDSDRCAGDGRVLYDPEKGQLVVTGLDVPVRLIAEAAIKSGHIGDLPIVVNNWVWGVLYIRGEKA